MCVDLNKEIVLNMEECVKYNKAVSKAKILVGIS